MTAKKNKLFISSLKTRDQNFSHNKISIIGSGELATTIAFTLAVQSISNHIVIFDKNEERLKAQCQDLQFGSYFLSNNPKLQFSSDYSIIINSRIIILAVDVKKIEGEDYLEFLQRNVDVYKATVPNVVHFCSNAVLLVVSATCDILSYVTWKLSGLPKWSIIGIGTSLETSRFRSLIANKLQICSSQVQGSWIIGDQNKSFPVWSSVNFLGVKLHELNERAGESESDQENWIQLCMELEKSKNQIAKIKQNSTWGMSLCCCDIISAILSDSGDIRTISVMLKEFSGIDKEVFLSIPCMLTSSGAGEFLNLKLNENELKILRNSANILDEIQKGINF